MKVFIVCKESRWSGAFYGIDKVFGSYKDAKEYVDGKNKQASYLSYLIKTKEVK